MSEKRIKVGVQQRFKDRPAIMLRWIDPDMGRRKRESAETVAPDIAKIARAEHECELNNGQYTSNRRAIEACVSGRV